MRLDLLRGCLSAVVCGLLLLVLGQGEAPWRGGKGRGSHLPDSAESGPEAAGGKVPERWERVENHSEGNLHQTECWNDCPETPGWALTGTERVGAV